MKNISEVAVGLAYSALRLRDHGLAAEVNHLEDRLDDMQERLETWLLRGPHDHIDPSPLRGPLHLSRTAEEIRDAGRQTRWPVSSGEERDPMPTILPGDARAG